MKRLCMLSYCLYLFPLLFLPDFVAAESVVFTDVTEAAGITWVHDNGMSAKR